ncbi:MAG: thiamine phosphate synthase [Nitrospira sp.]|nr:thiamine phosphate synthase [Nitrospira sp.]
MLDPTVRPERPLTDVLRVAATAGVRLFQYRDKQGTMKDAYRQALALRQVATEVGARLIINDRCDLALAVKADGVHLGQDDLPLADARQILGPESIIGLSTHNPEQVREAAALQPDYIGFGPIFGTTTKADHDPVVGLEGLRAVRALTTLPIFAIGGITSQHVSHIMTAGADGVAVISAILKAADLEAAIRTLLHPLSRPTRPTH